MSATTLQGLSDKKSGLPFFNVNDKMSLTFSAYNNETGLSTFVLMQYPVWPEPAGTHVLLRKPLPLPGVLRCRAAQAG